MSVRRSFVSSGDCHKSLDIDRAAEAGQDTHRPKSTYALVLIAATIVSAILSLFSGHLWMAKLRGQLVVNTAEPSAFEVVGDWSR